MNATVFPGRAPRPDQAAGIRLRVLSLGAGVQSTALALMAAHGEIGPMPDCAVFAYTGWERKAVYENLAWLRSPNILPFPVHIVSAGNLRADIIAGAQGERWASIPAFTRNVTPAGTVVPVYDEDENGEPIVVGSRMLATERVEIGMIRRQCTADYKIMLIRRKVRELVGITGRRSPTSPVVEQWIGISLDEAVHMKPSFEEWQLNRWLLIERGMTRLDCRHWLERHGYPLPPKSACIGCPFHSDEHWRHMRDHDPEAWADAVSVNRAIAARSIFIGRRCRSNRPISRLPPIAASSICGRTNAMGCAACEVPLRVRGSRGSGDELDAGREAPGRPVAENPPMAKSPPKITLSVSRDIPFDKLVLSQSNVRRVKAGVAIEELAEDIARRTLLQSLTVRPVLDESGAETGIYEVPAGGRRYRALELLVKQKRLARTAPVPCIVRTGGIAEEDSLAENVRRAPLHPLDQFRAFLALREKGQSEEDIAAAFFVSVAVVRQRLRLASVSPKLLEVYAEDGVSLDQLMAFTVNPDHARQEAVWEALQRVPARQTYQIRRMLTEDTVRASDRRARFVGVTDYETAGGIVLRDLFESDDGGWLQDPALLDRLVAVKLEREAEAVRAEGWKWVEVAPDFPYGHTYGLRRLSGKEVPLTKKETKARDALKAELDKLEKEYADAEEIPEEVDARLGEIETALGEFEDRPVVYDASEIARAGVFISIGTDGTLHVERGYVRPEDEEPVPTAESNEAGEHASENSAAARPNGVSATSRAPSSPPGHSLPTESDDEDEGFRPLSDRLMTELTAHRTLALREAVANDPDTAYLAILHALCLKLFYRLGLDSCLEVDAKSVLFGSQVEGLGGMAYARAIDARHGARSAQLPKDTAGLWDVLCGLDSDSRQALFAHCVGLTINATCQPYDRRPKAIAHADRVAETVQLDMAEAGWRPTVATYLGRVTKARILEAVREAKGEQAAQLIENLKKADMAREAERLLDGTGWLPEPLRLRVADASESPDAGDPEALPAFLAGDTDDGVPRAVAAE